MNSTPTQNATNSWWKDNSVTTGLFTLTGILIGSLLNYWITYKSIEEPKIKLEAEKTAIEAKKAAIEAHKQALFLTPTVATNCQSRVIDSWTFRVGCNSKNTGMYHAVVKIDDVVLSVNNDTNEAKYSNGSGFGVEYPNRKNMFLLSPGSDGDLWFYIKFDQKKFPSGIHATAYVARVSVNYSTIDEAKDFVVLQFPDLKSIVSRVASRNTEIFVYANPDR